MTTTVIDQLIVTLGLDPTNFKKGQKEAAKALVEAKDSTKKEGDEIGKALDAAGKKAVAFFLSFEAATKIAGWLGQLTDAAANMSLLARRTGESVHELDVFSRAVKISGGSAEEALGLVNQLTQEMTAAKAGAGLSPFLQVAQQVGVAWQNTDGTLRKATDVIHDLGRAAAQNGPQIGAMLLGRAGVPGGVGDFLLRQREEQEAIYAQAQKQAVLDDEKAKNADKLRQTWNEISDAIDQIGQKLNATIGPVLADAAKSTLAMVNALSKNDTVLSSLQAMGEALTAIYNVIKLIIAGWEKLAGLISNTKIGDSKWSNLLPGVAAFRLLKKAGDWAKGALPEDSVTASPTNATAAPASTAVDTRTRGLRNNNPGNLRLPGGPHDKDGFSIFATPEDGIIAAQKQIQRYAKRGINNIQGIISTYAPRSDNNNTEAYINSVSKQTGIARDTQLSPEMLGKILAAMFRVESGKGAPGLDKISSVLGPTPGAQRFGATGPTPTGGVRGLIDRSGTTNITHIDEINVHTAATDANGIAAGIDAAVKRKNLAAQADAGQS